MVGWFSYLQTEHLKLGYISEASVPKLSVGVYGFKSITAKSYIFPASSEVADALLGQTVQRLGYRTGRVAVWRVMGRSLVLCRHLLAVGEE